MNPNENPQNLFVFFIKLFLKPSLKHRVVAQCVSGLRHAVMQSEDALRPLAGFREGFKKSLIKKSTKN